MKMTSKTIIVAAIFGLATAIVAPAMSEDKQADDMEILRDEILTNKHLLVAAVMHLTEAEAKGFWPVYERYQDEQFLLRARTKKLIEDYAAAYEQMTNDKARQLLDESLTIQSLDLKVRQAYLPEFRKVLPDVKVVRYYQLENKIQAVLTYEIASGIPFMKIDK